MVEIYVCTDVERSHYAEGQVQNALQQTWLQFRLYNLTGLQWLESCAL